MDKALTKDEKMKNVSSILLGCLILIMLSACGSDDAAPGSEGEGFYLMKLKDKHKARIGYVVDLDQGFATAYIDAIKLYVTINPDTGAYLEYPNVESTVLYFPNSDCTGSGIIEKFKGRLGKTIIKVRDGNYYNVASYTEYDSSSPFTYESQYSWTGGCQVTGTDTFTRPAGNLEITSEPFNFTSSAPLTVKHEKE